MISSRVSNIYPSYREFVSLTSHADLFRRIAELACDLCKKLKKATLQAHDIQTAYVSSLLYALTYPISSIHTCHFHPYALPLLGHADLSFYSTKLILPGELAKHAQSEGCKALRTFNKHTKQGLR
jgi:hypothetical protein